LIPDRRQFLALATAGLVTQVFPSVPSVCSVSRIKTKAVVFDAFPILDPRPLFALAEQLFPGRGTELSNLWRSRQFEYQWLRALFSHYADFWRATEDSLIFAADLLKLNLTSEKRKKLMHSYLELKAWPDVSPALKSLKDAGIRLAFLSNATPKILQAGIKNSGLANVFEHVLSTDSIKTYKPDPRAYQMAMEAFRLRKTEILFVAFAGWDAAGAKAFGYPTFWVNRLNSPLERLGFFPDAVGKDLNDLIDFVRSAANRSRTAARIYAEENI